MYKMNNLEISKMIQKANETVQNTNYYEAATTKSAFLEFGNFSEIPTESELYYSNMSYYINQGYADEGELGVNNYLNLDSGPSYSFEGGSSQLTHTFFASSVSKGEKGLEPLNVITYLQTATFAEVIAELNNDVTAWGTRYKLNLNQHVFKGKYYGARGGALIFTDTEQTLQDFALDSDRIIVKNYYYYDNIADVSQTKPRIINTKTSNDEKRKITGLYIGDIYKNSYTQYWKNYDSPVSSSVVDITAKVRKMNDYPQGYYFNPYLKLMYKSRTSSINRPVNYQLNNNEKYYRDIGILNLAIATGYDLGCEMLAVYVQWDDDETYHRILIKSFDKKKLLKYLSYFGIPVTTDLNQALYSPVSEFPNAPVNPPDPINPGSKAEGYPDSDDIKINTPISSPSGGAGSIYLMNQKHLDYVRNGLWKEAIYQQLWAYNINPFDYVLGLWWYPFSVYDLYGPTPTESSRIQWTRVKLASTYIVDDDVPGVAANASINLLDGGKLRIPIITDSYLDYEPYTTYTLYIPYIGVVALNSQQVVGKTLQLKYFINIYDGSLTAYLEADGILINNYRGVVGARIPMTSYDSRINFFNIYSTGMKQLSATASLAGSLGAAAASGIIGSYGAPDSLKGFAGQMQTGASMFIGTKGDQLSNAFTQRSEITNTVPHDYGLSYGLAGLYTPQTAYVTIESSLVANPELKIHQEGKNSSISGSISGLGLTGYVQAESTELLVDAGETSITEAEKAEIDAMLKRGVYV